MQKVIFSLALLLGQPSLGDALECENRDPVFPNDSLEFLYEAGQTVAYYNDGDAFLTISCTTTPWDGYLCEGLVAVHMDESGHAVVERNDGTHIEFYCY
jgi:hypothetical protein